MSTLNILHIAAWWPRKENPFSAHFIRDQIRSTLHAASATVIHVEFYRIKTQIIPRIETEVIEEEGFTLYLVSVKSAVRRFGLHDMLMRRAFSKTIDALRMKAHFDLIHMHVRSHLSKHAIPAILNSGFPVVLTEHFSYYHRGFNLLKEAEKSVEKEAIAAFFNHSRVKAVLPVSKDLAEAMLHQFDLPKAKCSIIPNTAHPLFIPSQAPRRKGLIVACSHWNDPKDPMLFLNALHALDASLQSEVRVEFIGGGSLLNAMKSFHAAKLSNMEIVFHGPQPKSFIAERLQKAEVFVHPTKAENLPTVIIESLSCGTPVISMRVNGIPEMLDESNGLLVEVGDSEGLKSQLESILSGTMEFDHERIAEDARAHYSKEEVGRRILEVYQNAL